MILEIQESFVDELISLMDKLKSKFFDSNGDLKDMIGLDDITRLDFDSVLVNIISLDLSEELQDLCIAFISTLYLFDCINYKRQEIKLDRIQEIFEEARIDLDDLEIVKTKEFSISIEETVKSGFFDDIFYRDELVTKIEEEVPYSKEIFSTDLAINEEKIFELFTEHKKEIKKITKNNLDIIKRHKEIIDSQFEGLKKKINYIKKEEKKILNLHLDIGHKIDDKYGNNSITSYMLANVRGIIDTHGLRLKIK